MKYISYSLFLLFFGFASHSLYAQQNKTCDDIIIPQYSLPENSVWAFSDSLGLDFNTPGSPSALQTYLNGVGAGASVADSNGQLLFYTNGNNVWSANGTLMPNATTVLNYSFLPQVVQVPYQPGKYYLFAIYMYDLKANLIDMSLNNGLGDVDLSVSPLSGVHHLLNVDKSISAVSDCSGNAWLLVHDISSPAFRAFHITAAGIDTLPVISDFSNQIPNAAGGGNATHMAVAPNGRHLAYSIASYNNPAKLTYYDFDPETGMVSNPRILKTHQDDFFSENAFSPDNSKLYCTVYRQNTNDTKIYQYNFNATLPDSLIEPDTVWGTNSRYGGSGLRLGPDGKMYFASEWGYVPERHDSTFRAVGRINYPNLPAATCGFEDSVASVDFASLPNRGFFWGFFPTQAVIPQSSLQVSVQLQGDTLFAQPGNYGSYQWYLNGNPLANAQNPYLPLADTGLYAVMVTDSACGCTDSVLYHVTALPGLGIATTAGQPFRIYPNPTHDKIFVEASIPVNLSLYDLTGRLLRQSKGKNEMDISAFSEGVYLLRIKDSQGRFMKVEKVMKRK